MTCMTITFFVNPPHWCWTSGILVNESLKKVHDTDDRTLISLPPYFFLCLISEVVLCFWFLFLVSPAHDSLSCCSGLFVFFRLIIYFFWSLFLITRCYFSVFTARVRNNSEHIESCWEGAPLRWRCPRRELQSGAGCRLPSATRAAAAPPWWRRLDRLAPLPPICVSAGWEIWETHTRDLVYGAKQE